MPAVLALVAVLISPDPAGVSARSTAPAPQAADQTTPFQAVWPLPPDPARIRYVTQYTSSEDIEGPPKKSTLFRIREALLGRERVAGELPGAARFAKPYGIAVDSRNRIIVADTGRGTVFVLDPDEKRFSQLGENQRQVRVRIPISVAVDADDNIYVGDNGHGAIFVFGPDLEFKKMLTTRGQLEAPTGIAIDTQAARLYAVDTRQHALLVFDLRTGAQSQRIGRRGDQPGEFGWPSGVAVGPDGNVYVSDTMNYRVQVFDRDLEFIREFGALGVNPGEFRRPKGIAVDAQGLVYVVDSDFNNFQIFDTEGLPLLHVGSYGPRPGQMIMPTGIAIDRESRRIYVTEQVTRRVQVFERTGPDAGGH